MPLKKAIVDWDSLGFNFLETRSMYSANCNVGEDWENGSLIPFGNIELSPAAVVLNYGQGVFEGTKAFQTCDEKIVLFRIDQNARRLAWSTERLCIPKVKTDFFINAVFETVKDNLDFVPPYGKGSMYIRPIVWGVSPGLGVGPAVDYRFMIYVSPVGPYFKGDLKKHLSSNNYYILLIRSLLFAPMPFITFIALKNISLPEFTTLNMASPLFASIYAYFFLNEKFNKYLYLSLFIGFLGVIFVVQPGFENFNIYFLVA